MTLDRLESISLRIYCYAAIFMVGVFLTVEIARREYEQADNKTKSFSPVGTLLCKEKHHARTSTEATRT